MSNSFLYIQNQFKVNGKIKKQKKKKNKKQPQSAQITRRNSTQAFFFANILQTNITVKTAMKKQQRH